MDEAIVHQILDELLSALEPLDTHSAALLQFLKAKGIATDEDLAPFLEQAGNASNVRWLAARVRINSLISSAMKITETKPTETKLAETTPAQRQSENESNQSAKSELPAENTQESRDGKQASPASQGTENPASAKDKDKDKDKKIERNNKAERKPTQADQDAKQFTKPLSNPASNKDPKKDAA
jgi:hypothetical protein